METYILHHSRSHRLPACSTKSESCGALLRATPINSLLKVVADFSGNKHYMGRGVANTPLLACIRDFNWYPPLQDTMVFCACLLTNVRGKVLRLHHTYRDSAIANRAIVQTYPKKQFGELN